MRDVEAFLGDERRWRTALVGGVAGGVAGAAGGFVPPAGAVERTLLTAAIAVVLALALVVLVGHYDRRAD